MRFANILLLQLYVGVTGELIVPVSKDCHDNWLVNVSFPDVDVTASLRLNWENDIVPLGGRSRPINFSLQGHDVEAEGTSNYSFEHPRPIYMNDEDIQPLLSVSPRSRLVRNAGSIALVHSSVDNMPTAANLVIESLMPSFNRTCYPGSMIEIQQPINNHVTAAVRIGQETFEALLADRFVSFHDSRIAVIPFVVYGRIHEAVRSVGGRWSNINDVSHCSQAVIESLPVMEIIFPEFGLIALYPDDYMKLLDNDQCVLLLEHNVQESLHFELFKIPGVNVRVSENRKIEICDAHIEAEPELIVADARRIGAVPRQSVLRRFLGCIGRLCTR